MTVLADVRPAGLDVLFRPGTTLTAVFTAGAGELDGRVFTSTLDAVELDATVLGDTLTVVATAAQTAVHEVGVPASWELLEDLGGDDPEVVAQGTWTPSDSPQAVDTVALELALGTVTVTVELAGAQASIVELEAQLRLETIGAAVGQVLAVDWRERWLDYIRDAGSLAPSDPSRRNLGGDFVGVLQIDATNWFWFGSDAWAGGAGAVTDDVYGVVVPFRNWLVAENAALGLGGQVFHAGGGDGAWLDAELDGGEAAGAFWWLTGGLRVNLAGDIIIVGHLLTADDPESPTLGAVDTSIITVAAVLPFYVSHVNTNDAGWNDANFWLSGLAHDTEANLVYGPGTVIDLDAIPPAGPDDVVDATTGKKLGRVAEASIRTLAAWEFWTGAAWSPDVTLAATIVDTDGTEVRGLTGAPQHLGGDSWLWPGRINPLDPFVDVWASHTGPQGPYTKVARVPVPGIGGELPDGSRLASHHAQVLPDIAAGDDHSVVMLTCLAFGSPTAALGHKIHRWTPHFVRVPHFA
jgi:hypothetical protein